MGDCGSELLHVGDSGGQHPQLYVRISGELPELLCRGVGGHILQLIADVSGGQ